MKRLLFIPLLLGLIPSANAGIYIYPFFNEGIEVRCADNKPKHLISFKNILIIQDIDGVCIPLVKDPMTRKLESKYIYAAKALEEEFFVLTCGEHEGPRGVNRIIERSLKSTIEPKNKELYLRFCFKISTFTNLQESTHR